MKRVIIFGATSAIAQATARVWAAQGAAITICAKEAQRLPIIADDLKARGASEVHTVEFAAESASDCEKALASALVHGCDVALLAHGILTDQPLCQRDAAALSLSMNINFISYAVLAEGLAAHFEKLRSGTLILISSVAGDRGRASNYLYGAAKAGVTALASGLRGRLAKSGVNVVTVKPGFVNTPMTAHLKKGALFVGPEVIAASIVAAEQNRRAVAYSPWFWRFIMGALMHVPERLFHKLPI